MIPFRSPWLAHIPQVEVSGRLLRQSRRFTIFLAAMALLVLIFILIQWPIERSGPVYPLYWLHDRVFLPLRAYTFTIFFPTSIIWWGLIGTALLLWTISKLSDRSLLLPPHILLLRFAVHQPALHPLLLHFAERLHSRGYPPDLLRTVTEQEWALAGQHTGLGTELVDHHLERDPAAKANPIALQSFVKFTHLLVSLYLLPNNRLSDRLNAAVFWYETLLRLIILDGATEGEQSDDNPALFAELAACGLPVAEQLAAAAQQTRADPDRDDSLHQAKPFSIARLAADMRLTLCSQPTLRKHLTSTGQTGWLDTHAARYPLAHAVATRRALLGEFLQQLELDERRSQHALAAAAEAWRDSFDIALTTEPALEKEPADLTLLGRLSLQIAIYTAVVTKQPEIALGAVDAVETLNFTLAFAAAPQDPDSEMRAVRQQMALFLNEVPTPTDYQLCAALQTRRVAQRQRTWAGSPLDDPELILPQDFALAFKHIGLLAHAAGPPPLAQSYHSLEQAWVGRLVAQLRTLGPGYRFVHKYITLIGKTGGRQLVWSLHSLSQRAAKLEAEHGWRAGIATKTQDLRQLALTQWDTHSQQVSHRYREYIVSGEAQALLQKQWRQLQQIYRQLLDAIRKWFG